MLRDIPEPGDVGGFEGDGGVEATGGDDGLILLAKQRGQPTASLRPRALRIVRRETPVSIAAVGIPGLLLEIFRWFCLFSDVVRFLDRSCRSPALGLSRA